MSLVPAVKYNLQFKNVEGAAIKIVIEDYQTLVDDTIGPVADLSLTPSGDPLHISVIDNDESKFKVIRAKQATIKFLSDSNAALETFCGGQNNRFKVTITADNNDVFIGFLVQNDNDISEAFLPQGNEVTLTAVDGLGSLKDIPLTNLTGDTPQNQWRIIDFIAWCLAKTNIQAYINVIFNIKPGGNQLSAALSFQASTSVMFIATSYLPFFYVGQQITIAGTASNDGTYTVVSIDQAIVGEVKLSGGTITDESGSTPSTVTDTNSSGHFFDKCYLDTKTFEEEIGSCINCYDVLERILGYEAELFQKNGQWWILRLDEVETAGYKRRMYTYDGTLVSDYSPEFFDQFIGKDGAFKIFFSEEGTLITNLRERKFSKLTYRFENPKEVVCNVDFSRGDLISVVTYPDPAFNEKTGIKEYYREYHTDCWTQLRADYTIPDPNLTANVSIYWRRDFNNDTGQEIRRYAVIEENTTAGSGLNYIVSDWLPVNYRDKIRYSFSNRMSQNSGSGTGFYRERVAQIRLLGDDGSRWTFHGGTSGELDGSGNPLVYWQEDTSGLVVPWKANNKFIWIEGDTSDDKSQQRSQFGPGETLEVPVTGKVQFCLFASELWSHDTYIDQPSIELLQYINGAYQVYTGRYHKVSRSETYSDNIDDQVYVSDSPSKLFKGAIFVSDGTNYSLISKFFDAVRYPSPTVAQLQTYSAIQIFDVWNQYRNTHRMIQAVCQGLGSNTVDTDSRNNAIDLLHRISIGDVTPNTKLRYFKLLSFDQDWYLCSWRGTMIEMYKTDTPKQYDDTHEISYITT